MPRSIYAKLQEVLVAYRYRGRTWLSVVAIPNNRLSDTVTREARRSYGHNLCQPFLNTNQWKRSKCIRIEHSGSSYTFSQQFEMCCFVHCSYSSNGSHFWFSTAEKIVIGKSALCPHNYTNPNQKAYLKIVVRERYTFFQLRYLKVVRQEVNMGNTWITCPKEIDTK